MPITTDQNKGASLKDREAGPQWKCLNCPANGFDGWAMSAWGWIPGLDHRATTGHEISMRGSECDWFTVTGKSQGFIVEPVLVIEVGVE